jgi:hypothetical protein
MKPQNAAWVRKLVNLAIGLSLLTGVSCESSADSPHRRCVTKGSKLVCGPVGVMTTSRPLTASPSNAKPTVAPTAAMPTACSRERFPLRSPNRGGIGYARGRYPVFVGLGTAGVVRYAAALNDHGWYYYKTLWSVAPAYRGPVRVTGHQINGPNRLLFSAASGFPGDKLTGLSIPRDPSSTPGWRFDPSDTLIRADGCYLFKIEGRDFTEWISFLARK